MLRSVRNNKQKSGVIITLRNGWNYSVNGLRKIEKKLMLMLTHTTKQTKMLSMKSVENSANSKRKQFRHIIIKYFVIIICKQK